MIPVRVMLALGVARSRSSSLLQIDVFGREWDLHTMVAGALLMIVGTQVVALGLCAHAYGTYFMGEKDPWFDRMRARFRLEHGLMLGGAVAARSGLVIAAVHRRPSGSTAGSGSSPRSASRCSPRRS